jgi:hypothetical protein
MKQTILSEDRMYRYTLWREWGKGGDPGPYVAFVMLNPSTADENKDDPTIRRCIGFAKAWGYSSMAVVNLFAYRATEPAKLIVAADPVGPANDLFIPAVCSGAALVVCAWGATNMAYTRAIEVMEKIEDPYALTITKTGHPGHPLYLPATSKPVPYSAAEFIF